MTDLARRIIARDLFKQVPCTQDKLSDFLAKGDSHQRLYEAVGPFCPGQREFYVHVDHTAFQMLSDESRASAFFIDLDSDRREATLIRDYDELRVHPAKPQRIIRLFVPREAVESVKRIVEGA